MKNFKPHYLLSFILLFTLSCESSDTENTDGPIEEITDDYNLLAVSDKGEIFEIGNNSGAIENISQINKESGNTLLSPTNLTSSQDKIYAIEYIYNPSPTNNLLIFDRQKNTSQVIPLDLPQTIVGDERGIIGLTLDNNNLIGVLAENVLQDNSTKHLININLEDYTITELGITFNEDKISSLLKINSMLYISTWGEGLLEINLTDKTVNTLNLINGSRLAKISNTELAIMQAGSFNASKPGIINLSAQTVSDKSNGETYGLVNVFGSSIYHNQIYLNLISSSSLNLYLGILKTNFNTNTNTIVKINTTNVNRNLIILGTNENL